MSTDQSVVAQWNELMLEAIREGGAKPTATTYQLYLTSAAIYDAWAAYDDNASGIYGEIARPGSEQTDANKAAALSHAAHAMLTEFFPGSAGTFDAFMEELGLDPADTSTDPATAAGVGNLAAQTVLEARAEDGSNYENDFADTTGFEPVNSADPDAPNAPGGPDFDANQWQPLRVPTGTVVNADGVPIIDPDDPSSYEDQEALTPQWGSVMSFALESGDQFRPPAPPQLGDFGEYVDGNGKVTTGDAAYREQVEEVRDMSATLTTEEKVIAEFWADGPRTESPPGHWNQIAQDIALREGHGIDEDAKMFLALNAAIFDAGIATWEAKYEYNYIRPQSAIRHLNAGEEIEAWAGPNLGTQTIDASQWQPYQDVTFVTPPFPEFVSGHSTFSMAAAKTIAAFVGSDTFYDGETLGTYDLDDVDGIDLLGQYVATELAFEDYPDGEEPVVLQWETLTEAAEEAGISRLYGGIHIQDGNLRGLELGEKVAANAENRWESLFTRGGDDTIAISPLLPEFGGGWWPVFAGAGDDIVVGSRWGDWIFGEAGDDLLKGRKGDDDLIGGDGNDKLIGHRGDDWLEGGDGSDLLKGGRGADTFVFNAGETGIDLVRDFDADWDTVALMGFDPDASVSALQQGRHAQLLVDGEVIAQFRKTDASDLVVGETVNGDIHEVGPVPPWHDEGGTQTTLPAIPPWIILDEV